MSSTDEDHLQRIILQRIESALDGRTWSWLARASGIPRSTLATQAAIPRFTVEVLLSISRTLDREMTWFLTSDPVAHDQPSNRDIAEAFQILTRAGVMRVDWAAIRRRRS